MAGDLYHLMVMAKGQEWVKTFPAETREEAEQRGKRMGEKERKKGVEMKIMIVTSEDVLDTLRQALAGNFSDLVKTKK